MKDTIEEKAAAPAEVGTDASSSKSAAYNEANNIEKATSSIHSHSESDAEPRTGTEANKSRGVAHIEAVIDTFDDVEKGQTVKYIFGCLLLVIAWVLALDGSLVFNFRPIASSSFDRHSMISTVEIASSLIGAIAKPFLAKISDFTSRPITYFVALLLYTLGYVIVACSPTIAAYVIGEVFISIGSSGITLMNSILVADLTPLKWRGFMNSMLSTPYIINTWFAGLIADAVLKRNWRWGYGMFAILTPAVVGPAILVLLWMDRRAQRLGKLSLASSKTAILNAKSGKSWGSLIWEGLIEIDALGLILLGFSFSLILLPFSLYSNAEGGWKNPSMIAMLVVGGILMIIFTIFELWFCPSPCMPKRIVMNRTFICAVIIDFIYMLAGYIRSTYFSSYVFVVKNWSVKEWTYYNNTLTMSLCIFGVVAGVIQRITHRYKYLQTFGLAVKLIGMGLFVHANGFKASTGALVMGSFLVGMGGAFSVVGSRVASEASVPHQDLALVISLLSLWSSVGAAIGSAIASPIWVSKLPVMLRHHLPKPVNETLVTQLVASNTKLKSYPWGSEVRIAGIKAYGDTTQYLFIPALCIAFIPLFVSLFQTNYYLGDQRNSVEGEQPEENRKVLEVWQEANNGEPQKWTDKLAAFFSRPLRG